MSEIMSGIPAAGIAAAGIVQRLESGAVLGAGVYVFELERRGYIKAVPYVPWTCTPCSGTQSRHRTRHSRRPGTHERTRRPVRSG